MWPKMLLEFLPHLTRLIPAADRYLNSRQASDKAHEAALESLTDELRGGFTKAAQEQAALRGALQQHVAEMTKVSTGIGQVRSDVAQVRAAMDGLESRLSGVERRLAIASWALWAALALIAATLVLIALLLLRK